jgi:hypothetical protein
MRFLTCHDGVVYDTDIEERIHSALWETSTVAGSEYSDGLCIKLQNWPGAREFAKEMIIYHRDHQRDGPSPMNNEVWLPKMAEVVNRDWFLLEGMVKEGL